MRWFATSRAAAAILLAAVVVYPLIVYIALPWVSPLALAVGLILLAGLRFLTLSPAGRRGTGAWALAAAAAGVAALAPFDGVIAVKAYPILISLGLAAAFAWTLAHPPTAIERFARLAGERLDAAGIAYTRRVTIVWLCFFVANAGVSAWTATRDMETWSLYNGLVSYLLIGTLFAGEYVVRRYRRRRAEAVS